VATRLVLRELVHRSPGGAPPAGAGRERSTTPQQTCPPTGQENCAAPAASRPTGPRRSRSGSRRVRRRQDRRRGSRAALLPAANGGIEAPAPPPPGALSPFSQRAVARGQTSSPNIVMMPRTIVAPSRSPFTSSHPDALPPAARHKASARAEAAPRLVARVRDVDMSHRFVRDKREQRSGPDHAVLRPDRSS